ncbi:MAG: arylsulfatase [Planctomycetes bacterium]|nr:arylsulfatase [Planctomycetota bacterium]
MSDNRPNVLLFTTDQHRGDHLSIAGHPVVETPNLDALINRGAYFPNAFTEIPSTPGARRCLLGGQGSHECGLIGYSAVEWHPKTTVAQVLADAGYHCLNTGFRNIHPQRKLYGFHHVIPHFHPRQDGPDAPPRRDPLVGEDDYVEWLRAELGPMAHDRGTGCDINGWLARPWHLSERYHPTVWTINTAIQMILKRDPTRPFFMWCSTLRPHSPYDPPQVFWDMYIHRKLPEIPIGDWAKKYDIPNPGLPRDAFWGRFTPEQNQRMRAAYMGCITQIDYEFGRMMEVLRRYIDLDNTLILFTSDHGDMMGEHHLHRKGYAYEGSIRIPFLVGYPKGLDLPSGTFDQIVGLRDVMPTILDACGVDCPDPVTGSSVFDAIRGEKWREFTHGEHGPVGAPDMAMQYLTDAKEKYIWFPVTGEEQFFDLRKDPKELRDLAKRPAHAKRVKRWRSRLIAILGKRGDGFSDGKKLLKKEPGFSAVV